MACQSKSELLDVTLRDYGKLRALIEPLDAAGARASLEGSSIKDVVGHRAHWIDLFLGWYHDGQAGKQVFFPAEGYKWNDLKRYNADLRDRQSHLSWSDVCDLLQDRHEALVAFIQARTDPELYEGPMKGANNKWTPGRWAEAAGPSHYRSASKFIRAVLRQAA